MFMALEPVREMPFWHLLHKSPCSSSNAVDSHHAHAVMISEAVNALHAVNAHWSRNAFFEASAMPQHPALDSELNASATTASVSYYMSC